MTMIDRRPVAANPVSRPLDAILGYAFAIYRRHTVLLGVVAFVLYLLIVLLVCVGQPLTDWDALAYIAIAAERSYDNPAALHAYAYGVIKDGVELPQFNLLTQDGGYRSQMFADPAGFVSMLGMYRVKWLYCEIIAALTHVMPPLWALRFVSGVSAVMFATVSLLWLRHAKALALAPAFCGIMIVSGFTDTARGLSPDMLFSAFFLAGLYAHVRGSEALSAALLLVAFLVRPDNLIFLGGYAVLLLIYRQWSWGVFAAFVASLLLFKPLVMLTGQPGWWEQLYFASVEKQSTLEGFHPAFSATLYLYALVKQFLLAVTGQTWVGVYLLALFSWFIVDRSTRAIDARNRTLLIALTLGIIAKFVLVPIFDTRIYFAYLMAIFLTLSGGMIEIASRWQRDDKQKTAA